MLFLSTVFWGNLFFIHIHEVFRRSKLQHTTFHANTTQCKPAPSTCRRVQPQHGAISRDAKLIYRTSTERFPVAFAASATPRKTAQTRQSEGKTGHHNSVDEGCLPVHLMSYFRMTCLAIEIFIGYQCGRFSSRMLRVKETPVSTEHCSVNSSFNSLWKEFSNACLQTTLPRPDDGQQTLPNHQAFMREAYAEIAERGWGRLQGFVSAFNILLPLIFFALHTPYPAEYAYLNETKIRFSPLHKRQLAK